MTELVQVCSSLLRTKQIHLQHAETYLQLFNIHTKDGEQIPYTDLQQFYQRMCEFHSNAALTIEARLIELTDIVDTPAFDDVADIQACEG